MKKILLSLLMLISVVGCAEQKPAEPAPVAADEVDVVVVGAGLSGVMAARELKVQAPELNVVVYEKTGVTGGALPFTGGAIASTNSKMHQEQNHVCTNETIINYVKESSKTEDLNDALITNTFDLSSETADLLKEAGLPLLPDLSASTPHNPDIYTAWVDGKGAEFNNFLTQYIDDLGLNVELKHEVTDLIVEDGTVVGVKVKDEEGESEVKSKLVILATGGFSQNPEMLKKYIPNLPEDYLPTTPTGQTGDGFRFVEQFNTEVTGSGTMGTLKTRNNKNQTPSTFCVGLDGKRFTDETQAWYRSQRDFLDAGLNVAFNITSETEENAETLAKAVEDEAALKFNTLEEVADHYGIDKEGLLAEAASYTEAKNAGKDLPFGLKNDKAMSIEEGPYYVSELIYRFFGTLIGITVDENLNVLDGNGEIVNGLLACGELTISNAFTTQYPGAGFGISYAANTGRLAAHTAIDVLK